MFSGDCVPLRAGPSSSSKERFSASSVLVHRNFVHKVKVFGPYDATIEFDLSVYQVLRKWDDLFIRFCSSSSVRKFQDVIIFNM